MESRAAGRQAGDRYAADNGASGEDSPNGSVNEGKFFNGWPDEIADNLALIDELGTPNTHNHYPTGWAVAFSNGRSGCSSAMSTKVGCAIRW